MLKKSNFYKNKNKIEGIFVKTSQKTSKGLDF